MAKTYIATATNKPLKSISVKNFPEGAGENIAIPDPRILWITLDIGQSDYMEAHQQKGLITTNLLSCSAVVYIRAKSDGTFLGAVMDHVNVGILKSFPQQFERKIIEWRDDK